MQCKCDDELIGRGIKRNVMMDVFQKKRIHKTRPLQDVFARHGRSSSKVVSVIEPIQYVPCLLTARYG